MQTYRIYFIDPDGRISRPAEIIGCADDQEATEKARHFIDGLDIELWHETRCVAKFPRK